MLNADNVLKSYVITPLKKSIVINNCYNYTTVITITNTKLNMLLKTLT